MQNASVDADHRLADETEPAQSQAVLRTILDTVPDALIVIGEDGHITSFSQAAVHMFGYEEAEVLGKNVNMLMPSPHREAHDGFMQHYLDTGEKHIIGIGRAVEALKKDGTIFPIHLEVGEAVVGDHRLFTGFVRDLTEQKKTEAEMQSLQNDLLRASRLSDVGTLASALAHEINQPLTAITNYMSAARDMIEVDEDDDPNGDRAFLREALSECVSESLRAGTIVRRLREFVTTGEINRQKLSLAKMVEDATTLGLVGAHEDGVDWSIDIGPGVSAIYADRVQMQQVMVNLMRNAIEAMQHSQEKKLRIVLRSTPDDFVEITVSDTGPGIDPEIAKSIFNPFASTKGDGMGLGLSICRTIVEAHDGTIEAEEREDGGTVFRVRLPKISMEEADVD